MSPADIKVMKNKYLLILLTILVLGAVLRLYNLTNIPPGVNRDEASIGYTAYSLLLTGKDEYGKFFPVSFQSFGDWKLPLYIYATAVSVKIFGLTEFAVRFPSAIFGSLTILLTYILVKEFFGSKREKLALLTAFLLAISPWSIHLSRTGSEANTAVFLTVASMVLLLKAMKGRMRFFIPGSILLSLTYYTYAGNHIFTTLLVLGIIIFYNDKIPRNKWTYISILLFIILSGFIFSKTLLAADKTKISGVSIFGDSNFVHSKIELLRDQHRIPTSLTAKIFHNPLAFGLEKITQNYLNSFSPEFLFIRGGTNNAHNIENFGNMYLAEAIFLFLGISSLIILKKSREGKFILYWLFISPIAASITKDAPHTARMTSVLPILSLVVAIGIVYFIQTIGRNKLIKLLAISGISIMFLLNFMIYAERYYVHFPYSEAGHWGLGYKKLNELTQKSEFVNNKVVISKPEESPYIFILFYSKYDPAKYQKEVLRYSPTSDGFVHVKEFGRFEFRHIDWSSEIKVPGILLVDSPLMISDFTKKQKFKTHEIVLPDKEVMFTGVEIDNRQIIP